MRQRKNIPVEEREKIVKLYKAGKISRSDAAHIVQVDAETIVDWVTEFETEGREGLQPRKKNRSYSAD